jgi:hypothetical protein
VRNRHRWFYALFVLLLAALACNFPGAATPTPFLGPDTILTYAAQTIEAELTSAPPGTAITPSLPAEGTSTLPAEVTSTAQSEATKTPGPCDRADFVADVTVPDGTRFDPNKQFVKTWRLKNTGTCTWNPNYSIVFDEGDSLGATASTPLTNGEVKPGEEVDVSVSMTAPEETGEYEGFWKLRNQAGQIFGLGQKGDKQFWVKIEVSEGNGDGAASGTYDFIAQASSADWIASGGGRDVKLEFGGEDDDPDGVAKLKSGITLENGTSAGQTLVTGPLQADDGRIAGTFPEFTVQKDNRFTSKLGFLEDCGDARVVFQLWVKQGDNLEKIKEWEKDCDGGLIYADVDLSDWDGKTVRFVLVVEADGSPTDDLAIWGSTQIVD